MRHEPRSHVRGTIALQLTPLSCATVAPRTTAGDLDVCAVRGEDVKVRKERERLGEPLHHDDRPGVRSHARIDASPDRVRSARL